MAKRFDLNWIKKAEGVWSCTVGEEQLETLISASGVPSDVDAINKLKKTEFPFKEDVIIEKVSNRIVAKIPFNGEDIYGLGLQYKNVKQNNKVFHLKTDHFGGKDSGRTHAATPFYVTSSGYGVLINTNKYVSVYAGTANRKDAKNLPEAIDRNTNANWTAHPVAEYVEAAVNADGVEIIVFAGENVLDTVKRYNLYCGGGCMPPKWGLGIWKRVPTLNTDKDVLEEVKEFEKRNIPLDVIGLEPGWHTKSYPCTFEWEKTRFENPAAFTRELLEKKIRLNLWVNPYISPSAEIYDALLPLSGSHNVWCGIVPDYSLEETRDILKAQHLKEHVSIGISGYKIDECDGNDSWLWPDHAEFPSGKSGEEMRQTYGTYMQRLTTEMYKKENKRTYALVRATNCGANSFPYVIYNDCYDFKEYITGVCTCGFVGTLWTPEVRSADNAEEWIRRIQAVCFSPMALLNSWMCGTQPWDFKEVEEGVSDVLKLRRRLIPYLYSAFRRYNKEGIPPFRAIAMDYNIKNIKGTEEVKAKLHHTDNPYEIKAAKDIKDQFMFGDSIMVAPMFYGEETREVALPNENWYDFYTGEFVGNGDIITVNPGLNKIPLYVKEGGIIPMVKEGVDGYENVPLEIKHYGKSEGSFNLYDDDGVSYEYENGKYSLTKLIVNSENGNLVSRIEKIKEDCLSNYTDYKFTFMTK